MSSRTLFIALCLVLGLFCWLAAYIHPFADDWSYAVAGMRTELLPRLWDEYNLWNGRYFSNVLVLRGPLVLGLDRGLPLYRVVPLALILLSWGGAYAFIRAVTAGSLDRFHALLGALLFVLLFVNIMPDLSEGIYWYTGAVTYQLANALFLFLLAAWAVQLRMPANRSSLRIAVIALLTVLIAGSNEVHMVFLILFHGGLLFLCARSSVQRRTIMAMLLLALACGMVVYLAPGNAGRAGQFPHKHELFHSLLWGAIQTVRFFFLWIASPALLLASVLYIPVSRWLAERVPLFQNGFGLKPWMALSILILPVFVAMVMPYWATGLLGQHRTVNATLFVFLPAWFMAITVWSQHLLRRARFRLPIIARYHPWVKLVLVLALIFTGNTARVVLDLWTGRMQDYDRRCRERYAMIEEAARVGADHVVIPELVNEPISLRTLQPGADPTHWVNRSMAYYFRADTLDITAVPEP